MTYLIVNYGTYQGVSKDGDTPRDTVRSTPRDTVRDTVRSTKQKKGKEVKEVEEERQTDTPLSLPLRGNDTAPPEEKSSTKAAVDRVWSSYLEHHERHYAGKNGQAPPQPRLTAQRRQLITARLREGYDAEQQAKAIAGMFGTPHNIGQNDRGTEYLGIEIALRVNRQGNNLERFRDSAPRPKKPVDKDPHSPARHGVGNAAGKLYDSRAGKFVDEAEWTPLEEGSVGG
jgi:hypothetical protein